MEIYLRKSRIREGIKVHYRTLSSVKCRVSKNPIHTESKLNAKRSLHISSKRNRLAEAVIEMCRCIQFCHEFSREKTEHGTTLGFAWPVAVVRLAPFFHSCSVAIDAFDSNEINRLEWRNRKHFLRRKMGVDHVIVRSQPANRMNGKHKNCPTNDDGTLGGALRDFVSVSASRLWAKTNGVTLTVDVEFVCSAHRAPTKSSITFHWRDRRTCCAWDSVLAPCCSSTIPHGIIISSNKFPEKWIGHSPTAATTTTTTTTTTNQADRNRIECPQRAQWIHFLFLIFVVDNCNRCIYYRPHNKNRTGRIEKEMFQLQCMPRVYKNRRTKRVEETDVCTVYTT